MPPSFRRIGRGELAAITAVELDPEQVARFLGPVEAIVSAVARGSAHSLFAISAGNRPIGFYVIHPELRDTSCWWLGWIALDIRYQGCGYGRLALTDAMLRLRRMPGCRRIRLLVAPDNARARGLYQQFGFEPVGCWPSTGEFILQLALPDPANEDGNEAFVLQAVAARARRVFRHRRLRQTAGPHVAWVIGVERGPPAARRVDSARRGAQAGPCRRAMPPPTTVPRASGATGFR